MKGDIENLKKALQDLLKQKQRQSPLLAKRKVTREVSAPTATATEKAATATAPTPTPPPITNTDPETETETEIETQDVQPEISPTPISEFSDEDDDLTNIINDITQLKKITQQLKVSVDSKLPTKIHSESQIETLENLAEIDVQLTLLATTKLEKSLFSEELAKYEESILKKMKEAATQQSPETDTTPTTKTTTTENRGESALEFKIRELGDRVGTNKLNLDKLAGELHDSVLKLKEDSVSRDFVEKQVSERSAGGVEEDEKYIRATTKLTHSIYFAPFSLGAAQARNFADEGKAADANADGHGRCQRQDWGSVDSKLPTKIHSESQIETLENLAEIDVQLTLLATTKLEKSLFSEELAKYEESILKKMKEAATQQSPETDTTPTTKTTTTENRGESALEFKIRELGDRVGTNKLNLDKLAGELHDSVLKLKEDSVSRDFVEKQVSERSAGGVEEDEKYIRATTKLTHSIYFAPFSLGAAQARNFADEGKAADANADGHGRCQRQDWGAEQGARGEAGPREHRGYAQGAGEHTGSEVWRQQNYPNNIGKLEARPEEKDDQKRRHGFDEQGHGRHPEQNGASGRQFDGWAHSVQVPVLQRQQQRERRNAQDTS